MFLKCLKSLKKPLYPLPPVPGSTCVRVRRFMETQASPRLLIIPNHPIWELLEVARSGFEADVLMVKKEVIGTAKALMEQFRQQVEVVASQNK